MITQEIEFVDVSTGKKIRCHGYKDANKIFGRSTFYIRSKVTCGEQIIDVKGNQYEAKVIEEKSFQYDGKSGNITRSQLCWSCGNACGGCSWSRSFVPVDGWEAMEVVISNQPQKFIKTYSVFGCPQYVKDGEEKNGKRAKVTER